MGSAGVGDIGISAPCWLEGSREFLTGDRPQKPSFKSCYLITSMWLLGRGAFFFSLLEVAEEPRLPEEASDFSFLQHLKYYYQYKCLNA